jgi:uncharacterized repeat protein (TIGR01451 family)
MTWAAHRSRGGRAAIPRAIAFMTTGLILAAAAVVVPAVPQANAAPAALSVTPLTWNVIGLDSNTPETGPNRFPVGARVCNAVGADPAGNVSVDFIWDSANAYVNLRPGSAGTVSLGLIAAGSCADAYFEVEVTKTAAAFDTTRRYHVTATDSGSGSTASTPQPRELFVEHLISQNRNGVDSIKLNGTSIPVGGSMTMVVGNNYTIELTGHTATQGYNQLEGFINFPNTIFQTLAVSTTYSADTSPYVSSPSDKMYADACGWENDPDNPNYRSCVGGDGKAGGTVVTTYLVKILTGAGASESLNSLLYDFSGSSYHYNTDFSVGGRIAQIVSPASVTISKAFAPRAIQPGGMSTMTFKLTNPTSETFTGVHFADTLLGGLVVAGSPTPTYSDCGAGTFSPAPVPNATALSFSGATLPPNSVCTITVDVSGPAGTYPNTTGNLFVNGSTDTGNFGQDTLTVSSAPLCVAGQTLATWTVPTGTTANPPDTSGGLPTTKAANVSTAVASASVPALTSIVASAGQGDSTSWRTWGYKTGGQYIDFVVDTSAYSGVSMSFYVSNPGGANAPSTLQLSYGTGGVFTTIPTNLIPEAAFTLRTEDLTDLTSTTGNTTFRLTATSANNDQVGANLDYDNISFTGCGTPSPAPTIAKSFAPDPIVEGGVSTLTFTIGNTATGNTALSGIFFSDVLPDGLSVVDASSTECGAGTLTATAATRTISLTGGMLAAGATCTFAVAVTGTRSGQFDNVTGYVSSTESGMSTNYAAASLTVVAPPVIAKSFSPASILTGDSSTLTFGLTNPNSASALTDLGFTDDLPAGVTIANSVPISVCGGSLTTTAPGLISFSGGSLSANASCNFDVTVTGVTSGSKVNTTSVITSSEGGPGNAATATLIVNDPVAVIDLNKQVSADGVAWFKFVGVPAGDDVYYRFSVYNGGDAQFTGMSVADPTLAGTATDPASCIWPSPMVPGDTAICVTGPVAAGAGLVQNIATASGVHTGGTESSKPSSATYGTPELTIDKSAGQTYFSSAGDVLEYSYVVTNSGFTPLLGPVAVADNKSINEICPAVSTIGDLDNYLDPGEAITCSATYTVRVSDVTAKLVTNIATATADGITSQADSVTVPLQMPAITIVKSASPTTLTAAGQTINYSFVITNAGNVTLTAVGVTDRMVGLSAISCPRTSLAPTVSTTCTATYTVTVADMNNGSIANTAKATGTPPSGPAVTGTSSTTITTTASPEITIVKSTAATMYTAVGQKITYTITATNSGNVTITGVTIVDPNATMGSCTPTTLAPGQSIRCDAVHTVTQADIDAGTIINTAEVSGDTGGVAIVRASNTVTVTVLTSELSLPQTDSDVKLSLPETGSDIKLSLTWAACLVAAGLIFRLATRRRHDLGSGTAGI